MTTSAKMKRATLNTYWLHERGATYGFWTAASSREAKALLRAAVKETPDAFFGTPTWSNVKADRV
jgi:hypothetical protein